jgi:hypothetical protein
LCAVRTAHDCRGRRFLRRQHKAPTFRAALRRRRSENMAAQVVSDQRLDWMLATLLEKITERGGSVSNRVKTLLTRFDLDNSGELEMDEFRSCLEDFLAGLQVRARRPVA